MNKVAFDAWLKTDPLHNPNAPPGPAFMPQYTNASASQASHLDKAATAAFDAGNHGRDISDEYVRGTVLLAVVLFSDRAKSAIQHPERAAWHHRHCAVGARLQHRHP